MLQLAQMAPNLSQLDLNKFIKSDNENLNIPTLESFAIKDKAFYNSTPNGLLKSAKKLKTYHVEEGQDIDGDKRHLKDCPDLEDFSLVDINISGQELLRVLEGPIKKVNLKKVKLLSVFSYPSIPQLLNLTSLTINETELDNKDIQGILVKAPNLKDCSLSHLHKAGPINFEQSNFANLETLTLHDLTLTSLATLYKSIQDLPQLRNLDLRNLKFPEAQPHIPVHNFFQDLHLTGPITTRLFDFLVNAPALEEIQLSRCTEAINTAAIGTLNLPALKKLTMNSSENSSLSANALEKIITDSPNLTELNFLWSSIKDNFKTEKLSLPSLKKAGFSYLRYENLLALFSDAPKLEDLTVHCSTPNFGPNNTPSFNLPSLKQLTFSYCGISYEPLSSATIHAFLAKTKTLEKLSLENSCIADEWGDQKYDLPLLTKLDLSGTIISEKGLRCLLASAPNLQEITLSESFTKDRGCNWSIETRQALLASNIKIIGREFLEETLKPKPTKPAQDDFEPPDLLPEDDDLSEEQDDLYSQFFGSKDKVKGPGKQRAEGQGSALPKRMRSPKNNP